MPPCEKVQMEVRDCFTAIPAIVDDHAEAVLAQALLIRNQTNPGQEVTKEFLVPGVRLPDPHDQFFGNEEEMNRGLGSDIAKAEAELVLVDDIARYFAVGNLLEDCFLRGHDSQ